MLIQSNLVAKLIVWTIFLVSTASSNNMTHPKSYKTTMRPLPSGYSRTTTESCNKPTTGPLISSSSKTDSCTKSKTDTQPSTSSNTTNSSPCIGGWDYNDISGWSKCYPHCGGLNQSPININSKTAVKTNYPPLNFVNYDEILPSVITDSGHTLEYKMAGDVPADQMPSISGGGLVGTYNFHSIHWHWSVEKNANGSDHTLDNKHYPVEMHLVHVNTKYKNIDEAKNQSDGLAVLGVFMEEAKWGNIPMRILISLVNSNNMTVNKIMNVTLPIPLKYMLPDSTDTFYRYSGSLTTPACQESVSWIIFDSTLNISFKQIAILASLKDLDGKNLNYNNRGVQPLNKRKVTYRSGN